MNYETIKIGGVPEHFNFPIHKAIESGKFLEKGVDLQWKDCKGGTGQMTKALRSGELDVCVLLTEGIVADIFHGNQSKIISVYVNTPLIWGIHSFINNPLRDHKQIYDKKYAISRLGSGSHLMAIVDANQNKKFIDNSQFNVVKNLKGALESLQEMETDVFYWEKFTTKPFVDKGILKRIGEFVSPWPCFVIAARNEILSTKKDSIIRILRIIHEAADNFMVDPNAISDISSRYYLEKDDVENWFHRTEWSIHGWVSDKMIKSVIFNLKSAGIIPKEALMPELIWKRE